MEGTARPSADFDAYWHAVDDELARYPAAAELEALPLRSYGPFTTYAVRLTSIGPYRIFAYFSVPEGPGPFPGLVLTPRYGSVNHIPDYNDRVRYAVLQIAHRGQRLADQLFAATYPGLLTLGIDAPATYIYRGIVADCIRGLEFFLGRPEVDRSRVAVSGDDLAVIAAARRPEVSTLVVTGQLLYRLLEARSRTAAYPTEELNDYLRTYPEREAAVRATLAYFDPSNHASNVTATTIIQMGAPGSLSGPDWLAPLTGAFPPPPEARPLTHEGGTDHDWLDAWLASRQGVETMSRFRRTLA